MNALPGVTQWLVSTLLTVGAAAAPVTGLEFSPDDRSLLVGRGGVLERIALDEDRQPERKETGFGRITDICFSPDGNLVAVSGGVTGEQGGFGIWSWPALDLRKRSSVFKDLATAVSFHPSQSRLAVAAADRSVTLWEFGGKREEFKLVHRMDNHSRAIRDLAYSPEGGFLVTVSVDRSVKVWDPDTGVLIRSLGNHVDVVNAAAVRPARPGVQPGGPFYAATASDDRTVRVWQPAIGRMVRIVRGHLGEVNAVAWSPTGDRLYSADRAGVVRVIEGDSDRILGQWQAHDDWIYRLAVSRDGSRVATGDWRGEVRLWRTQPGMEGKRIWKVTGR